MPGPRMGLTNRLSSTSISASANRLGRLVAALAYNLRLGSAGRGTPPLSSADNTLEVEGSGAVTVVDADGLTFSPMAQVREGVPPVCLLDLTVQISCRGGLPSTANQQGFALDLARLNRIVK